MSTTNTTSTLTATLGLSVQDLLLLDGARMSFSPGIAVCAESVSGGAINAVEIQNGTEITISVAGSNAKPGDVLRLFIDNVLVALHTLDSTEINNTTGGTTGTGVAKVVVSAQVLQALTQGTHYVTSQIVYSDNTVSGVSLAKGLLSIDTIGPNAPVVPVATDDVGQTVGTIAQGATTDDAKPVISGTIATKYDTIEVFDNGVSLGKATVNAVTGQWTLEPATALANGPHAITVIEYDRAGNPSPMSAPLNFIVDTGASSVSINTATDNAGDIQGSVVNGGLTDDTTPTLVGTAKANTVVTISEGTTVLGTTTADAVGNWSFTPAVAQTQGTHTYTAKTVVAGNTVTSSGFTLTVDSVAPLTPTLVGTDDVGTVTGSIAANGVTDDNKPTFSGSAEANSVVKVYDGVTLLGTTTANASGAWTFTPATALTQGAHSVTATATDAAGNTSLATAALPFTVDTLAPTVGTLSWVDTGSSLTDNITKNGTITVGALEAGATWEYSTDSGATWNTGTGNTFTLAQGTYAAGTVQMRETDLAGNVQTGALIAKNAAAITVDTTAPVVGNLNITDTGTSTTDGITNNSTVSVGGLEAGATWEYSTNNGATWMAGTGTNFTLAAGTYAAGTVQMRETDVAGNVQTGALIAKNAAAITVDNVAPVISLIGTDDVGTVTGPIAANGVTDDTNPTFSGTTEANAVVKVYDGATLLGTTTANASGAWTFTPTTALAQGAHSVTATATDAAGNTSTATAALPFTVDTTPPTGPTLMGTDDVGTIIGPIAANGVTDDTKPTFSGSAEANSVVKVYDGVTLLGTTTATATGTWSLTPATALTQGAHSVTATATDTAGVTSTPTAPLVFTIDTTAAVAVADVNNGTEDSLTLAGSVAANDTAKDGSESYSLVGSATGLYGNLLLGANGTYTYTRTANLDAIQTTAVETFTYKVTDAAGNSTQSTLTLNMVPVNDAAVIGGVNTATLTETNAAQTTTGTLTITDVDSPATFVAQTNVPGSNGYGKFSITTAGAWTYTMDTAHDEFVAGTNYTDSITVAAADGTTKVVTVTIAGTNDAAVISGTNTASLTETNAVQTASGTLTSTDVDGTANLFTAQTNVTGSNGYGKFSITTAGAWTYTMDTAHDEFVAGTNYTDSITVAAADGTTKVVTVTIAGTNDAAVISGATTGAVTEAGGVANAIAGTPTATGTLTSTDVDGTANLFTAVTAGTTSTGGYGTYAMTAGGVWTYTLNNSNATVQALAAAATLNDTFTVTAADGTTKVVTVTITGANDAAVISGTATGAVVEAGGVANAIAGTPTATGTLTSTDVDGTANLFTAVTAGTTSTGGYGTYAMTSAGVWTYTLNNSNATVQALAAAATLNDTFTVSAADGTTKVVTVTITGVNDAAVIGGVSTATLTETNAAQTASGTLTSTDVDGTANLFTAQTNVTGSNGYGKFSLTTAGVWTYIMDTAHDEFVAGTNYTDSITMNYLFSMRLLRELVFFYHISYHLNRNSSH